jgi:elongation factor Ts
MQISAAMVKELRERTGAGMMECKKALTENNGDIEAAIEAMRIAGQAKAAKKAGRVAAEGVIAVANDGKRAAMVELNSETDFVSKGDDFQGFAQEIAEAVLKHSPADLDVLNNATLDSGATVEKTRQDLIAKIGENISVRRFHIVNGDGGTLGVYRHGVRIGVLVDMQGGDADLAKDIAMHIAASRPVCVKADEVPQDMLDKEREIFSAQAKESGKPDNIIEKMVDGRIKKYLAEVTLLGQPFVKDPDQTVEKLLSKAGASVLSFSRFEVGEGIEKKSENFADEVMQQAGLK